MSAEAIAAVLHHSPSRGTDKLVLIGLAWHTNDNPEFGCFPSQETLANYCNVTVRQVRRALLHLEDAGEIEIVRHGGLSNGGISPNRYFIRLDCPDGCDGTLWHRDLSTGRLDLSEILDQ